MSSQIKHSHSTNTNPIAYKLYHLCFHFRVVPFVQFTSTASYNGIPPHSKLQEQLQTKAGQSERTQGSNKNVCIVLIHLHIQ